MSLRGTARFGSTVLYRKRNENKFTLGLCIFAFRLRKYDDKDFIYEFSFK